MTVLQEIGLRPRLILRRDAGEVGEPGGGVAVGGGAPVAAGGERAARAHLGGTGHGAALVLAHLEEALEEHPPPLAELPQPGFAFPRVSGAESDFSGRLAE